MAWFPALTSLAAHPAHVRRRAAMRGRTALITGITGQDGSHLAELLLANGYRVFGLVRRNSVEHYPRLEAIRGRIELVPGDLVDAYSLARAVETVQPDEVYNLGAMSFV